MKRSISVRSMPLVVLMHDALWSFRRGFLERAERICGHINTSSPENYHALHLLGLIQLQRGDAAGAADFIRRTIASDPDHPDRADILTNYGLVLRTLDRPQESLEAHEAALEAYAASIEAFPGAPQTFLARARLHAIMGRLEDAKADWRTTRTMDPAVAEEDFQLLIDNFAPQLPGGIILGLVLSPRA